MRNNHKWLVFLLAAVLFVNTLGISAMAAEDESPVKLYLSPAAEPGTVQVLVEAAEPQTVADGKLVFTYDADKLTYADAEPGAAWTDPENPDLFVQSVNDQEGKVILTFAHVSIASAGELFTLTFDAKSYDAVVTLEDSSYISGADASLAQSVNTCPSTHFEDMQAMLPEIHDAVDYMVAAGYMNGMSATHFGPNLDLNRAQMVTILYRIAGEPAVEGTHAFTDVPEDEFYTAAVIWAVENEITNGISADLFAPSKFLSRQELVAFLYRFAKYMDFDVTQTTDLSAYTDVSKVQPYAVEAFEWAVGSGIVSGTSATTLSPEDNTTRAQICIMVRRMLTAQN